MPNGGSDCCGTCWFNAKNKGEAGYGHADDSEPDFCTIRDLPIDGDPFYTYCGNHPHRRPRRDPIPIGPVFTGDSMGNREVWRPSPDTEEIRQHLLSMLQERPSWATGCMLAVLGGARWKLALREYPIGIAVDDIVIWQLGEFREARATATLRRMLPHGAVAREALSKIEGGRG